MKTLDPVDELLRREIPGKLWHYTSVQGFHGIVSSRQIFATDVRYLNDSKEFTHAREMASEVVAESPELGTQLPSKADLAKAVSIAFDTGLLRPGRQQVFVASFSAAEDQLSQWRGYSRGSSGVSIAFELSGLRPPIGNDTLVCFAPCVYSQEEKKELLRRAFSYFVTGAQAYRDGIKKAFAVYDGPRDPAAIVEFADKTSKEMDLNSRLDAAIARMQADLLRIAALLKDQSFREEQEWRLVLPVVVGAKKLLNPIRFRTANTTLIPYIAHPFSPDPSAAVPLVDLILGPGAHPNASQAALSFFHSEGLMVLPRESKVPYRPW